MPSRMLSTCRAALLSVGILLTILGTRPAVADGPRTAAEILKDYDAAKTPRITRAQAQDRDFLKRYNETYAPARERRAALAHELLQVDPDNPRLMTIIRDRWAARMSSPATAGETIAEIDRALPHLKEPAEARDACYLRALASRRADPDHPEAALPVIDAYIRDDPKDDRGAVLLSGLATLVQDPSLKSSLLKRLAAEFPNSRFTRFAIRAQELTGRVGQPLDLEFVDAIKGSTVSMRGLRGKVVVLDFWATWCGGCLADMPRLKGLYAKFHDQGVEFLGISLDDPKEEGGLDRLKEFVAKDNIPWPQFYQGNGSESEFSSRLGVSGIPRLFVVDAEGKIASIDARGKLEDLIPELLAKAKAR